LRRRPKIAADSKAGDDKRAVTIGLAHGGRPGSEIHNGHGGIGNDSSALIGHGAGNRSRSRKLCPERIAKGTVAKQRGNDKKRLQKDGDSKTHIGHAHRDFGTPISNEELFQ